MELAFNELSTKVPVLTFFPSEIDPDIEISCTQDAKSNLQKNYFIAGEGGAKEIHLRITCPPIRGPCFYGIDMSTISELLVPGYEKTPVSVNISKEICSQIAKDVGADSLIYQSIEGLVRSINLPRKKLCIACIDGQYPTPWGKKLFKKAWENHHKGITERTYEMKC